MPSAMLGRGLDHQHQQEGEGRQQDELPDHADDHRLGHGQHRLEVRHLEVERDAEHHQADDGVERPERTRIEIEADEVDHGCSMAIYPFALSPCRPSTSSGRTATKVMPSVPRASS
jgi:hypothetical protein